MTRISDRDFEQMEQRAGGGGGLVGVLAAIVLMLLAVFVLWLISPGPAHAQQSDIVGSLPYAQWIRLPSHARLDTLYGAMAGLNLIGVSCPGRVSVDHMDAAMTAAGPRLESHGDGPWIAAVAAILHTDYGCRVQPDRLKTFLEAINQP